MSNRTNTKQHTHPVPSPATLTDVINAAAERIHYAEMLESVAMLTEAGIPVCLRIQPIFPDSEDEAVLLSSRAQRAGAAAVSLEYLKIPREQNSPQFKKLNELYGGSLMEIYLARGLSYLGREVSFCLAHRKHGMAQMKAAMNASGLRVGIAENELLHYGDLAGCCNGASEHLKGSVDFDYNVPALLKSMSTAGELRLSQFDDKWAPVGNIGRHFNSRSRFGLKGDDANWRAFFAHRWRSKNSLFNPVYFDGVSSSDETDAAGNPIYRYVRSSLFPLCSHGDNAMECPSSMSARPPISSASARACASSAPPAPPPTR